MTLAHRKFKPSPKSLGVRNGICSCGGTLHTIDHGTWVGYNCPKCTRGGSYTK